MPEVPFPVRALYDYQAEQDDDLPFSSGQKVTVDEVLDADWYHGYYTDATGNQREGIFPITYVAVDVVPPARPTRGPAHTEPSAAATKAPTKTDSAPQPAPVAAPEPAAASRAPAPAAQSAAISESRAAESPLSAAAPAPAPVPAAQQPTVPATVATPAPLQVYPKGPAPPTTSDDDWGDEEGVEEEEKTISLAPPKATAPPEVTAELAAGGNTIQSGRPSQQNQAIASDDKKIESSTDSKDVAAPEEPKSAQTGQAEEQLASQVRLSQGTSSSSADVDSWDSPAKTAVPADASSTRVPSERRPSEHAAQTSSVSGADKEPDFKTRLARFNQGNAEEDKPKPAPKRTGTRRNFQPQETEEESSVAHPGRDEVFKPSMSMKERIAMLQQNQQEEQEAAEAAAAAEERRRQRRAEAEASRRERAELEAKERAEAEAEARERAAQEAAKQAELEKQAAELKLNQPPEIPHVTPTPSTSENAPDAAYEDETRREAAPPPPPPVAQPGASRDATPQAPLTSSTDDASEDVGQAERKPITSRLPGGFGFGQPLPRDDEHSDHEDAEDGAQNHDEDEAEARRMALRQRMARLANSSGGMNLGMIMGGGFGAPGGAAKKEHNRELDYESMSPAEIEAAEARREAEESVPVSIMPGAGGAPPPASEPRPPHEPEDTSDSNPSVAVPSGTSSQPREPERTGDQPSEQSHGAQITPRSPTAPVANTAAQESILKSPGSDKFHDANETHEVGSISESAYDGDSEATDTTATPLATPGTQSPRPVHASQPTLPPQAQHHQAQLPQAQPSQLQRYPQEGRPRPPPPQALSEEAQISVSGLSEASAYESDEDTDRPPNSREVPEELDPVYSSRSVPPPPTAHAVLPGSAPQVPPAPTRVSTDSSHVLDHSHRAPPAPPAASAREAQHEPHAEPHTASPRAPPGPPGQHGGFVAPSTGHPTKGLETSSSHAVPSSPPVAHSGAPPPPVAHPAAPHLPPTAHSASPHVPPPPPAHSTAPPPPPVAHPAVPPLPPVAHPAAPPPPPVAHPAAPPPPPVAHPAVPPPPPVAHPAAPPPPPVAHPAAPPPPPVAHPAAPPPPPAHPAAPPPPPAASSTTSLSSVGTHAAHPLPPAGPRAAPPPPPGGTHAVPPPPPKAHPASPGPSSPHVPQGRPSVPSLPPQAHPVADGPPSPRMAPPVPPQHTPQHTQQHTPQHPYAHARNSSSDFDFFEPEQRGMPARPPPPAPIGGADGLRRSATFSTPPPAHAPPPPHAPPHQPPRASTFGDASVSAPAPPASAGRSSRDLGRRTSRYDVPAYDPRLLKEVSARIGPEVLAAAHKYFTAGSGAANARAFISGVPGALLLDSGPGVEVYSNFGNASVQQVDEIRPGDVCVFEDATFQGSKGPLQKYNKSYKDAAFVVESWDGTKKKLHFADTKRDDLRVTDLRMGVVRIYRVVDNQFFESQEQ